MLFNLPKCLLAGGDAHGLAGLCALLAAAGLATRRYTMAELHRLLKL